MKLGKLLLIALCTSSCLIAQIEDENTQQPTITIQTIDIGLTKDNQQAIIQALRSLLADNYVLYTKALNFHWNVEGKFFSQLHEFFKSLYELLQSSNDLLAERIRALGSYAPASLHEFLSLTQLKENSGHELSYISMLQILLSDFEIIIRSVRSATVLSADHNDWGTNNMLAGMLEELEKKAWMIRAHLRK